VITVVEWPKGFAADQWPEAKTVVFRHVEEGRRSIRIPEKSA